MWLTSPVLIQCFHIHRRWWANIKATIGQCLVYAIFPHKAHCSWGRRLRPCWISVKTIYWSGAFLKRFFQFDPSLTSGMSTALMQGHCLRHQPDIKQHHQHVWWPRISQEVSQTALTTSHQTRDVTCARVGFMLSQRRRQWANIK